jgi:hypothetical protein
MSDEKPKRRLISFADIAARQAAASAAPKPAEAPAAEPEKRVTYADLAALSKRPEDFATASRPPQAGTPEPGTPDPGIPSSRIAGLPAPVLRTGIPDPGTPTQAAPVVPAIAAGTPVASAPVSGIPPSTIPRPAIPRPPARTAGPQVRYALRARDGHSPGEQAVYQALWTSAEPYAENSRIVTLGYRALSRLCGLTVNNCKANLRSLAGKLAIEEAGGYSYTQAKTYIVYGEAAIMQRRKAAGFTHYIKSRGVVFVNPETGMETGAPEPAIPTPVMGTPEAGIPD